ncbi:hypothetical protein DYQ86_17080 [Acidobacteria bacterium AB60]|nr:hypothetical protein DYQ86_17080 [Acidobacteria bacterium AB60]
MKVLTLVMALCALAQPALSQPFDTERNRLPVTVLTGPWRFHTGDNPLWAKPQFDDSHWALLQADRSWTEQGFAGYAGLAWYRLKISVPPAKQPLAILLPSTMDSFELYADDSLIGSLGTMPPTRSVVMNGRALFRLPAQIARPGQPLLVAIRVWHWPSNAIFLRAGILSPPVFGDAATLDIMRALLWRNDFWATAGSSFGVFANGFTALAGLALFALRRKEREYLWFGMAQLFWACNAILHVILAFRPVSLLSGNTILISATSLGMLFNVQFFVILLHQRKRAFYWTAIASVAVLLSAIPLLFLGVDYGIWNVGATAMTLVYGLCVPAMLIAGVRRGNRDAKLLVAPFTLSFAVNVLENLAEVPAIARQPWGRWLQQHLTTLITTPFPAGVGMLCGDLAMFSVAAVLVLRYARSRRDEERLEAELEAARAVQNVLIPEAIPSIPGLRVECVYKPAGEVGGDFFQILPLPANGVLLVIGDVSGKGMPAAMTVSLLVGMVRMLARTITSPAAILAAINQNILGRSGGFTTCLMLAIDAEGKVTVANAGHLAPYVNGREVPIPSDMPLGVLASTVYTETAFSLADNDQLLLLTDGVPEARNANGELFGFERAASMSNQPAAAIARAAQQFGQSDDITVLSVKRQPPSVDRIPTLASALWSASG